MSKNESDYIDDAVEAIVKASYQGMDTLKEIAREALVDARGEWQDIDTAPKDGTPILCWDGVAQFVMDWDRSQGTWFDGLDDLPRNPTHWRPLAPPPRGTDTPG